MSENDSSLPRLLDGRYRLDATLGSGGMGIVYRATDETMHRHVAVKLVRTVDGVALEGDVAERFLREAKNTARVQHENIIEVYDFGRTEDDMYFVMELLDGESLAGKLRREGRLSPATTVHVAVQMCAALLVAHAAGVVHRDLKPANIMLIDRAGDPEYVKVLDFGVAKSVAPDQETVLTRQGVLVGTVEYMAPEQILGRPIDARTDIYALGILMYRMLCGKVPFREATVAALMRAHLDHPPPPMTETATDIPGALERVVLRCLEKDPDRRYASMADLSSALTGALDVAPAGANKESPEAHAHADSDATIRADMQFATELPEPELYSAITAGDSGHPTRLLELEPPSRPNDVLRFDILDCAMCQTPNPIHARACSACGMSLARADQEAARARVTAPQGPNPVAPPRAKPTASEISALARRQQVSTTPAPASPFSQPPAPAAAAPSPASANAGSSSRPRANTGTAADARADAGSSPHPRANAGTAADSRTDEGTSDSRRADTGRPSAPFADSSGVRSPLGRSVKPRAPDGLWTRFLRWSGLGGR